MGGVIWGVPTFVTQLVVQVPVEQVFAFFGQLVAWSLIPMFRFRHRATAQACEGRAA